MEPEFLMVGTKAVLLLASVFWAIFLVVDISKKERAGAVLDAVMLLFCLLGFFGFFW